MKPKNNLISFVTISLFASLLARPSHALDLAALWGGHRHAPAAADMTNEKPYMDQVWLGYIQDLQQVQAQEAQVHALAVGDPRKSQIVVLKAEELDLGILVSALHQVYQEGFDSSGNVPRQKLLDRQSAIALQQRQILADEQTAEQKFETMKLDSSVPLSQLATGEGAMNVRLNELRAEWDGLSLENDVILGILNRTPSPNFVASNPLMQSPPVNRSPANTLPAVSDLANRLAEPFGPNGIAVGPAVPSGGGTSAN